MRRLVEKDLAPSSLEADAADLFRAAETADTDVVKQRVRERLVETRVRSRPRFVLAPAIFVGVLAIGTVASATLAVRWWRGARVGPAPVADPAAANRHALAPAAPTIAAVEPAAPEAVADVAPPVPRQPPPTHVRRPRAPAVDAESSILFDATRALRREQDPARAGVLLDGYFRRFPHGALAEEALALAIEAAEARSDARARVLARRYLGRYPTGHYRERAERALAGPAE
jgi:hypothetical protein